MDSFNIDIIFREKGNKMHIHWLSGLKMKIIMKVYKIENKYTKIKNAYILIFSILVWGNTIQQKINENLNKKKMIITNSSQPIKIV